MPSIQFLTDLLKGLTYVPRGFKLITQPGIRTYILIPLLINTLLFTGGIGLGAHLLDILIQSWLPSWLQWLYWVIWLVFAITAFGLVFFGFSLLANLLSAPFNSDLADAVENRLLGQKIDDSKNAGWLHLPVNAFKDIASETQKLIYIGLRTLPFLVLLAIPGLQIVSTPAWFLFSSWSMALQYLDYPMANHHIRFARQREHFTQKRSLVLGYGIGVTLLMLTPILNFMVIPVAVAGATALWVEQLRASSV
jgi:CysZ protein